MWNGAEWFSGGMHEASLQLANSTVPHDCTMQPSQQQDLTSCKSQAEVCWRAADCSFWIICPYVLLPLIIARDLQDQQRSSMCPPHARTIIPGRIPPTFSSQHHCCSLLLPRKGFQAGEWHASAQRPHFCSKSSLFTDQKHLRLYTELTDSFDQTD